MLKISSGSLVLQSATVGTPTWTAASGGSWTNANNWTSLPANTAGAKAIVGSGTSAPQTITLDSVQTVGQLTFSNTTNTGTGYTLAAGTGGTLTMDNSGGTATVAQILVTSGSHGISAPLVLAESLSIVPSAGTTLDISGNISQSAAGKALSLDGVGTLILSGSNSYGGGTAVDAGTLIVKTSSALPDGKSLTVAAGGTFVFNPAAGGAAVIGSAGGVAAVPEPGTLVLLLAGLAVFGLWRRRGGRD